MDLIQLNPYIRYGAIHSIYKHKPFDSICYDCRLFFFREGSGFIVANGVQYPFRGGTVFYLPPGSRYRFHLDTASKSFSLVVINFDLTSDFSTISASLGTASEENFDPARLITYDMPSVFSHVISQYLPDLESALCQIAEAFLVAEPLYRETASSLLKLSLLEILRSNSLDESSHRTNPVLEYIHANYSDPGLSNQTVAEAFGYHPYYLSQLVKRATGQTLHQYITAYRLRMAKQHLVTTDMAISTIAWKTGFQSTAYFIKIFKRELGVTPGVYRKNFTHILF